MRLYLIKCSLFNFSSRVRVTVRFSVWLVSGYEYTFVLLSTVTVTLPYTYFF